MTATMTPTRRLATGLLALTLTISMVPGCATWQQQNNKTKGAVYGTGVGAAAGAAIGAIVGGGEGAAMGAAIGAGAGALAGLGIGAYMDKQQREMQGVMDRQDRLERRGDTIYMSLSGDVLFATDSSQLYPGGEDKMREIAGILQRYPRSYVEIIGHTDSVGAETHNQSLSERRATAVADVLASAGVTPSRIVARGAGEARPVADNGTADGRARNRRVDITIKPDDSFDNA
jgi:outer membrane protein OmpA-like peptidoglycan-associated protein